ncbi:subtilisin-like serine protease PR1C [Metarhizium guizhouense ARSEF 977]|uniref:Subtilisin-like serine protease PR1C n=1 Tax=Metarhizium guizhouense (strain ARSEF 977) TaxID=1276136 RepID=A0A0B4HWY9_METGA|nr:subtilisin-like serine protease PR1C [Metarhizium guizhouense ARSEF 977]
MVRPWSSAFVCLAAACLSTWAATDQVETASNIVAGALIIECEGNELKSLADAVQAKGGEVRHTFDSQFFRGISVQLANVRSDEDKVALMDRFKSFTTWPVSEIGQPDDGEAKQQPGRNKRRHLGKRDSGDATDVSWHLAMTQIDKLHKEGFTGNGIRVAIVDTGVNYTHEAFGACTGVGPHCRVVTGDNFSWEGQKGDPMDCNGHGTALAGVVGGYDAGKYVGVAPNATLMAYRILDCKGKGSADSAMKGWEKAALDGAQIIVSAFGGETNSAQDPLATMVSRIAARGIICVGPAGNSPEKGAFNSVSPSAGRGVISVGAFSRSFNIQDQSSYGPTWDLDIKPSLGAPGADVPTPKVGGGYGLSSGTSIASPFAAGVAAVVAEALGKNLDWATMASRLVSTAKPQQDASGSGLVTVAQQGGGLISAWDAAHATTLVQPSHLSFNDTDHRVSTIRLSITNTAQSEVTYQLSPLHATTLYAAKRDSFDLDPMKPEPVQATADIKLSQSSLTLQPGESGTIDVSATDPSGLDPIRLPIWSGWISINGSDSTVLTIPFLGLAGSLRSAAREYPPFPDLKHFVGTDGTQHLTKSETFVFRDPTNGQKPGSSKFIKKKYAGEDVNALIFELHLGIGSPRVRLDIVPEILCSNVDPSISNPRVPELSKYCVPDSLVTEFAGVMSIGQVPGFPFNFPIRNPGRFVGRWNGEIAYGKYAPPSRYRIALSTLAPFGDAANESDWQTGFSSTFSMAYEHNII